MNQGAKDIKIEELWWRVGTIKLEENPNSDGEEKTTLFHSMWNGAFYLKEGRTNDEGWNETTMFYPKICTNFGKTLGKLTLGHY